MPPLAPLTVLFWSVTTPSLLRRLPPALEPDAFAAAWAERHALTREQAVDLALTPLRVKSHA